MHKSDIESDLQLHIGITATSTNDTQTAVSEKVTATATIMEMVFEKMQSLDEKEWAALATRNGGDDGVLASNESMKRVFEKQTHSMTLVELAKELGKDVESVLAEYTEVFEQEFGAVCGETALAGVAVAIQPSQTHQTRRREEFLNTLGMYLNILLTAGVASIYTVILVSVAQAMRDARMSAALSLFSMIKTQVTHFAENSRIVALVLDEVGEVHPFIQGVPRSPLTL